MSELERTCFVLCLFFFFLFLINIKRFETRYFLYRPFDFIY